MVRVICGCGRGKTPGSGVHPEHASRGVGAGRACVVTDGDAGAPPVCFAPCCFACLWLVVLAAFCRTFARASRAALRSESGAAIRPCARAADSSDVRGKADCSGGVRKRSEAGQGRASCSGTLASVAFRGLLSLGPGGMWHGCPRERTVSGRSENRAQDRGAAREKGLAATVFRSLCWPPDCLPCHGRAEAPPRRQFPQADGAILCLVRSRWLLAGRDVAGQVLARISFRRHGCLTVC